ncbi:hypothetical protein Poli38472_010006 [Pythium oligandrum]|uniref:Uncharacterized protein n=1 Tax=Pythium oligandrum TaxID=41045 RepID=A0A8K1C8D0_PYTOL|nr:hypothetical protein Poli38472_010006 [Pythium oligandrum]|eukprot:TMW58447.1 hypothetical protein Poli38472_010006 [Pythium oligandrum]
MTTRSGSASRRSQRVLGTLCVLVLFANVAIAVPSVPVDSFAFSALEQRDEDTVKMLVNALQSAGIVSIRDIPEYQGLRALFLQEATGCALKAAAQDASGLLARTLKDGTQRLTISTKTRYHHPDIADTKLAAVCPQYVSILRAFSELVNIVAVTLAAAVDAGGTVSSSSDSLEAIVSSADHLDHFHAYSSPSTTTKTTTQDSEDDLSLELHTDNGVMIFMTAPELYSVKHHGSLASVPRDAIESGPEASGGLVMVQPESEEVVQPHLRPDELVVMIGEGYSGWLKAKHAFPPVLHGMKMPQFSSSYGRVARAWYGKMILLPKDKLMKNTKMTFDTYTKQVTEYVVGAEGTDGFSAVACPPYMELHESDKSCVLQLYEPREDSSASKEQCMKWCNTHDGDKCRSKCEYVASVPSGGLDCWMLCIPKKACPAGQVSQCDPKGAQRTVCLAP